MSPEAVPRVRLSAIPDDQLIVVRGVSTTDRADAVRFRRRFHEWDRYGLSGFLAVDDDEMDVLMATRLERFEEVDVYRRADLIEVGFEVVPTFRRPHVTIAHRDLDALVTGLGSCDHGTIANRHREGGIDHG